jgi:hypothetical protein
VEKNYVSPAEMFPNDTSLERSDPDRYVPTLDRVGGYSQDCSYSQDTWTASTGHYSPVLTYPNIKSTSTPPPPPSRMDRTGTHRPRDTSSIGRIVQGKSFGDTSVRDGLTLYCTGYFAQCSQRQRSPRIQHGCQL